MIWVFRDRSNDKLTFKEQWEVVKKGFAKGVKYDGCTAAPDLDFGADCCGEHDAHYQLGDVSRWQADRNMRRCISKKGYVVLPWIYWFFVRVGAGHVWDKYRNKDEETTGSSTDGLA
jgi:hypothetical protein